ncbi:MLP-like protein, partial [Mya arenaria]
MPLFISQVDGNWADWSSWGQCDVTCENGTQLRTRTCTNPEPKNGGTDCVGSENEKKLMADGAFGIVGVLVLCPVMQDLLPVRGIAITLSRIDVVTTASEIHLKQGYACKDRVLGFRTMMDLSLTLLIVLYDNDGPESNPLDGDSRRTMINLSLTLFTVLYDNDEPESDPLDSVTVAGHNGRLGVYVREGNLRETAAATTLNHPCSASSVQDQICKLNHAQ